MSDQYQRITQAQWELWEASPVTKTYLQCLTWAAEQLGEVIPSLVDSTNNDRTCNLIHSSLGEQSGLQKACNPKDLLEQFKMLEEIEE